MDDLFGDEADAVISATQVTEDTSPTVQTHLEQSSEAQHADLSENEDLFGDEYSDHEQHPSTQEDRVDVSEEIAITTFSVPNHKNPNGESQLLYLAKLPSYLDVSSYSYDAETLFAEIQQFSEASADADEKITKKRSLVNTIRWKYIEDEEGHTDRASNSRFIKWSDGSMSLQVGEELFDVPLKRIEKEHSYLTLMHAEEGLLRGMQRFSHSMSFQPFGISSKSHTELKADIARRAITSKGRTVKLHTDMIDPAELQKQAMKLENEKQKARRRLDNQKARALNYSNGRDRTQLTARYLDDSDEELGAGKQRYTDENEDGFIEDDENEDEELARGARLQALKDAGIAEYKNKSPKRPRESSDGDNESEDESIVYEDGIADDSEEEAVMTPKEGRSPIRDTATTNTKVKKLKRRIADSDDDEI